LKGRLSSYELFYHLSFALRVTYVGKESYITNVRISSTSDKTNLIDKWLHPDMTMDKVQRIYGAIEELKYYQKKINLIFHIDYLNIQI
jgi:hypothetical protein